MPQHLVMEEFTISGSSVSAAVSVSPLNLRVSDELAATLLAMRPTLAEHTCKQQGFGYFGDKLVGSTLPHLVEHLAIDLLVEESRQKTESVTEPALDTSQASHDKVSQATHQEAPRVVAGITRWLDSDKGKMQVKISCTAQDADKTCRAITQAIDMVNGLLRH